MGEETDRAPGGTNGAGEEGGHAEDALGEEVEFVDGGGEEGFVAGEGEEGEDEGEEFGHGGEGEDVKC